MSRYSVLLLLVPHLFGASLTIDGAIKQFVEHNYDLQIARHSTQKSRADLITAKERPNPILLGSYEFMDINKHFSNQARGSDAQLTLLLTHPIETAGKRDRRIDMAVHSITFSDLIYDETLREQLITLIDSYYTVLSDQADLANAQENSKAYTNIVTIAKTKLDNGFLSLIDYQKILLQQIDYTKEVENSRLALVQDRETLASMLALSSSDITTTAPIDFSSMIPSLEELLAKTAERPDCKAAKQNLAVADASLNLEKANGVPNVSVGAEYASFGPYYEPLAGFNVSMPLPIYDRNEGDIEKARISTLQASSLYDKTLRMAKADIIQSYEATRSRQNVYKAMSEGFNAAKELKEKQEKIFALKGISVLELLDAQKSYREYQKNMTHALIDLHIATQHLKLNSGLPLTDSKGY
ncbi:MAG: TolC family protein [Sulfuricurvum sp.]|nr:TolC family protein [Sulfuricurvum sp.]MDD5386718.1 TolC family protein [Sulfuricurvum sp.]